MKLNRQKAIAGKEEMPKVTVEGKTDDKTEQKSEEATSKLEVKSNKKDDDQVMKIQEEVEELLAQGKGDADVSSQIGTLQGILHLLQKPTDIRKKESAPTDKTYTSDVVKTKIMMST